MIALVERDLVLSTTAVVLHKADTGSSVTWPTNREFTFSVAPYDFASYAEYKRFLNKQQYSAVLFEGSLLQLTYVFDGHALVKHRLCYYPCPVALADLMPDEENSFYDLLDQHILESAYYLGEEAPGQAGYSRDRIRFRSPLRFDFDWGAARPGHPCSHFTVCSHDCRIPVYGPISPGHFVRFVFSRFYPSIWDKHEALRNWPIWSGNRSITTDEEHEIHVECRQRLAG